MDIFVIVGLSLLAEAFELSWQYAPTIKGSLDKVFRVYKSSIFLFLALHTGYLYILFVSLRFDILNFPLILAVALKTLDIFTKLELIKRVFIKKDIDLTLQEILNQKSPFWVWAISPLTYPYLIYWALTWQ